MSHSVISGQLAAAVADAGTFTVNYPTGKNLGSFYLAMGHMLIMGGTKYKFPDDFNVTLAAANITITNASGATWPIDTKWRLQMEEQGGRLNFREERDTNRSAILPVTNPSLVASAVKGTLAFLNLGAPITADPDGILNDKSATTTAQAYTSANWESTFNGTLDVPRTLSATGTSGSDHVITVIGTDVYGRGMRENLTLSGTTKIWGKKAFKTVTNVNVAAGAAGDTFDLGWEDFLGLPVFVPSDGHILGLMKDGVMLPKRELIGPVQINQTDLLAGTSQYCLSHFGGYVTRMTSVVQVAVTTGGAITLEIETVAVTGLSVVVANSSAVGDIATDVPTTVDGTDATLLVAERGDLEIVLDAAFATAGAVAVEIEVNTTGILASGIRTSNGSTATTGDVRGTFLPPIACNGSRVFQLAAMLPDPAYLGIDQWNG
jgi:hypothetical protein